MRLIIIYLSLMMAVLSPSQQNARGWRQLAPPDTVGMWICPARGKQAMPVWGHAQGMAVGLAPMPGPRGLIRIYTPYLGLKTGDVMNFIALEPVPEGSEQRGFSELEMSALDEGRRGKRFWSSNGDSATSPLSEKYPARGVIEKINGEETLTLYVFSEPFDNGAKVYVRLRFYQSRPYEFEITTYTYDDSVDLAYFITTATMGNKARLRILYLKEGQKTSLELWSGYSDNDFTPHQVFSVDDMIRDSKGNAYFVAAPNETNYAETVYAPETTDNWRFKGIFATQYWIKKNPSKALQGLVNGRFVYWAGKAPIPGGIAYENFELKKKFRQGDRFVFGITPLSAAEFIKNLQH
ncbi:MAG: hypothetical protein LBE91_10220 [Tannerella sp.]|jgi:hypothetical protein|nr:hypothetical protein [Tannerella sp.]